MTYKNVLLFMNLTQIQGTRSTMLSRIINQLRLFHAILNELYQNIFKMMNQQHKKV